jgi:cation:H+ antiporter
MWDTIGLFIFGFFLLTKGASYLINGASSIARILKISPWVIGVLIVGVGTSIPEFSIQLASVFKENDVGLGSVIGSSIFDILVVLGLATFFSPLVLDRRWVVKDFLINLVAPLVAAVVLIFPVLGDASFVGITKEEGLLLTALFVLWVFYMLMRRLDISSDDEKDDQRAFTFVTSIIMTTAGILGVFFGGQWVVDGAVAIAEALGASSMLIGLSLVGIGTSLPELFVSITAVIKHKTSMAVGNIVGSTIFDFLAILGIAALFQPLPFPREMTFDLGVVILAAVLLFVFTFSGRRYVLKKRQGLIFLLIYAVYFIFMLARG